MPELLVFDVESTGVDTDNDRIVQLVAALADTDGRVKVYQEWLIDPGVPVPQEASDVHGFSTEYLQAHGVPPVDALTEARTFFGTYRNAVWTAFNLNYDASILTAEMARHGVDPSFGNAFTRGEIRLLDPLVIDRAKVRKRRGKRRLMDLAPHYGIVVDEGQLHNARYDVEVTAQLAAKVVEKYGVPGNVEQARWHRQWAEEFEIWLNNQRDQDTEGPVTIEKTWPLREKEDD